MEENKQNELEEILDAFYCPITQNLMEDPVMDHEGITYEKQAILEWLKKNPVSPITRNPLQAKDLIPNRILKETIDKIRNKIKPEQQKKQIQLSAKIAQQFAPEISEIRKKILSQISFKIVTNKLGYSLVSINLPDNENRLPCDICIVIDVSGSMGVEATLKNNVGRSESYGLNQLDLVKHAAKAIISNLQPCDRLAIVTFSSQAQVHMDLTVMDQKGQKQAITVLESLKEGGQTNLWDGLQKGLESLRIGYNPERNTGIFLLTDGQPNIIPPRGNLQMLQRYLEKYQEFHCVVNTYGFGYELDSQELDELSIAGGGVYAFIPDSSLVGSIFVNAMSNFMSIGIKNAQLNISTQNGAQFITEETVMGRYQYQFQNNNQDLNINIPFINYGQTKDFIIRADLSKHSQGYAYIKSSLKFLENGQQKEYQFEGIEVDDAPQIEVNRLRLMVVERISYIQNEMLIEKKQEAQTILKQSIQEVQQYASKTNNKFMQNLAKDLTGQVTEALSRDEYYKKWGIHYLPSLVRAHQQQLSNNFKDPGVQNYGGTLFQSLRDNFDEAFNKLPPPKPSIKHEKVQPIQNMAVYNDAAGGCFTGNSLIRMSDNTMKFVKDLKKGDAVMTPNNIPTKIKCIIITKCKNNTTYLVELSSGLQISPWHPVRIENEWKFPCYIQPSIKRTCDYIYNLVLESEHVVIINNIEVVTLGHNFKGDVIGHEYFGSQQVIKDLSLFFGWKSGLIYLQEGSAHRDEKKEIITQFSHNVNSNLHADNQII